MLYITLFDFPNIKLTLADCWHWPWRSRSGPSAACQCCRSLPRSASLPSGTLQHLMNRRLIARILQTRVICWVLLYFQSTSSLLSSVSCFYVQQSSLHWTSLAPSWHSIFRGRWVAQWWVDQDSLTLQHHKSRYSSILLARRIVQINFLSSSIFFTTYMLWSMLW